jgi:hypothetical protein
LKRSGKFFRCCWLLFASAFLGSTQSLSLSDASVKQADRGSIRVSLTSLSDHEPVALQWDLVYPADQLAIQPQDLIAGSAASAADKMLQCAVPPTLRVYRCILVGGQKVISGGPVAVINFQVSGQAKVGEASIYLRQVIAISLKSQRINLPTVRGKITLLGR